MTALENIKNEFITKKNVNPNSLRSYLIILLSSLLVNFTNL